jgi:hypothetical protein
MNIIKKGAAQKIGFDFIEKKYIPKGKNEFHLRDLQQKKKINFYALTLAQINILIRNGNQADDWSNILVSKKFDATLIKNCTFYGLNRIGNLSSQYHEFHDFRIIEGIYNSTIISCDIGNNVCIDNVNYMSRYIIDDEAIVVNVNEMATTDIAKFGNGILKEGEEDEKKRMIIEVCNENGGRYIIPYDGMLAGDAFIWSKYRDDTVLLDKLKKITEKKFDKQRGHYGQVGKRTVIKNTKIIKDVHIGSDAYIKGANKLKNLTINSDEKRTSQIGEGCELVNGIIGYGCRIFYGVKAVRFITASHSQLKYGARLINSYLGNNSTISCCEVLNSMIFPSHEQHHNNSFLCASLIMGQSNIAAGATIGSNHNSRSADGEIVAGRGFWPGLCVSLKHNSKFASFTMIAKGDYPAELHIPLPFCLISNDVSKDQLIVLPAYWFMYNMYALERNAWKYHQRDKRILRTQNIEFDYLAPDTINETFDAITFLKKQPFNKSGEATVLDWENSKRETTIIKAKEALEVYNNIILVYGCTILLNHIKKNKINNFNSLKSSLVASAKRVSWINIGGQLIQHNAIEQLKKDIKKNKITSWDQVHAFYEKQGKKYEADKVEHAFASLLEILNVKSTDFNKQLLLETLGKFIAIKEKMTKDIFNTRNKDYTNPFRKMIYDNNKEMLEVMGKIEENSFINEQLKGFEKLKKETEALIKKWK